MTCGNYNYCNRLQDAKMTAVFESLQKPWQSKCRQVTHLSATYVERPLAYHVAIQTLHSFASGYNAIGRHVWKLSLFNCTASEFRYVVPYGGSRTAPGMQSSNRLEAVPSQTPFPARSCEKPCVASQSFCYSTKEPAADVRCQAVHWRGKSIDRAGSKESDVSQTIVHVFVGIDGPAA